MSEVPTLADYVAGLQKKDAAAEEKRRKKEADDEKRRQAKKEEEEQEQIEARKAAAAASGSAAALASMAAAAATPRVYATPGIPANRIPEPPDQVVEPCLDVLKDGERVERYALSGPKETWTLGRDVQQCDFRLNHDSISRQHAAITVQKGQMYLTDLKSVHGTFVDGRKLPANVPMRLTTGANLKFGASTRCYIFRLPRMGMHQQLLMSARKRPLGGEAGDGNGEPQRFRYRSTRTGPSDFSDM
eukprot:gnl/TRDRNA2_/TRDRNA2_83481_c0_seq1.p1 gnl/TRDRNA2_/TRDRNA2_83481_c0~~gnl/TRDRNA2_/TRDRNA2_83481_c0_seq1.p1  ORF type:complete len:245 (-),score=62.25 gnl/TRDRNA2_/TRDRNA2_83481_c0_seq1:81-815(-)